MEDLVDSQNVFYFGRTDFRPLFEKNGVREYSINNCVGLSIATTERATTVDDVTYDGVGISIQHCQNERFLCHGEYKTCFKDQN